MFYVLSVNVPGTSQPHKLINVLKNMILGVLGTYFLMRGPIRQLHDVNDTCFGWGNERDCTSVLWLRTTLIVITHAAR